MKKFNLMDYMYFGLFAVAFVLLALNAVNVNRIQKERQAKLEAIDSKLEALASSTDAINSRIDGIEQELASTTDATQQALDGLSDLQQKLQDELKKVNDHIDAVEQSKRERKEQEEALQAASASYVADSGYDHPFRSQGTTEKDGFTYTWYSQRVLPGGGLDIPGRHVSEDGFVRDADGNICVASDDLDYGAEVETPYGKGKVYDTGSGSGNLDLYTDW